MSGCGMEVVRSAVTGLGYAVEGVEPLVGDASRRIFFRAFTSSGTVVAALYPEGAEEQAVRDVSMQTWGRSRGLPIPDALGRSGCVTVSEDVGDEDLGRALEARGTPVLELAIEALASFQRCGWGDCPVAPFDAAFFRRELALFEANVVGPRVGPVLEISRFLDDLAARLAGHPYRLAHRDFHANNLYLHGGVVRAVDYQDMRGGPDTYDAVSLLRERAIGDALGADAAWAESAGSALGWTGGWRERYLDCAAQRGLKVVETFVRLTAQGRPGYTTWLPGVVRCAREAVIALAAPASLIDVLDAC